MNNPFNDDIYRKIALDKRKTYQAAKPYPHMVIDNFLPEELAEDIANEYPNPQNQNLLKWNHHDNKNVDRLFLDNTKFFPPSLLSLNSAMQQRQFLSFLETISGIDGLIADPYLIGGGAMATGTGGFLNVHVDFNWHQKMQLWRRLNVLIYLTKNWSSDWGGELELYSKDGKEKQVSIAPIFNRAVIFNTTSTSYHGQSSPLNCPKGVYRNVLSLFFYSSIRSAEIEERAHYTKYTVSDRAEVGAPFDKSPYSERILREYQEEK